MCGRDSKINLQRASERYQSEGVLIGRVYEIAPNYWEARWRLTLEDTRHEWVEQGEGLDIVLLAGVHESADRLASRYGGFTGTTSASGVAVKVTGIRTLDDYARALDYLDSLDEVRSRRRHARRERQRLFQSRCARRSRNGGAR